MPDRYTLLAALGLAPAALTEVVWSLHQDGLTPGAVHVLTTSEGARRLEAELLAGGRSARWRRLCTEVLHLDDALPVTVHVPEADGAPLADVRSRADDLAFGDRAYALVRELTDEVDDPPVVGSIAGGRRTMGAHVMAAFSLCARPEDRVVHVLATPVPEPNAPAYWPGDGGEPLGVDRVDVPLPRIRSVLTPAFVERVGEGYGLQNLLGVLAKFNVLETPTRVRVRMSRGHRSEVELLAADGAVLAEAAFTRRMLSIFLLLADRLEMARRETNGPFGAVAHGVPDGATDEAAPLVGQAHTAACINAVFEWCGQRSDRAPWASTDEVSSAISRYHNADGLGDADRVDPLVQTHLEFKTTPGHEIAGAEAAGVEHPNVQYWHWATFRALPVEVIAPEGIDGRAREWPFRTIQRPRAPTRLGPADRPR